MITALMIISAFNGFRFPATPLELWAFLGMALLGFVDDRLELRARWKAAFGLLISGVLAAGVMVHIRGALPSFDLFGIPVPPCLPLVFTLLVLLFWCLPQAFNLIDGANGLATGFALVVTGSLWASGASHPRLAGALLACLVLNWPRSRLFLGDCGSLSTGLLLVIYAQKAVLLPNPNHILWLFSYPIIDVLMVMCIRLIERRPVFAGDRSHLHYQIGAHWPAFSGAAVPALVGISALCASEIYLTGRWLVLPYTGLAVSLGLSGYFTFESALHSWKLRQGTVSAMNASEDALPAK